MESALARPSDDVLLSPSQGQELFGCGHNTWYDLINSDPAFPRPVRIGRRYVRFWKSELIAYAESRRVPAPAT
jgi:predicted DNA-binding transcriptional regulator AlpA